ncbi:hypothetical protein LSUE1_G001148 [Lachnellula suecica]|uniref:Uncharacterized protein n=1 Tax=Lachnellula suecica TaxID=602035 RepID=A0A8T9CD88_9HELO|nr:hypothetical protein LSUE1_G001148 [Lachnellula suecica]
MSTSPQMKTPMGAKYGVINKATGRSGLTPVDSLFPVDLKKPTGKALQDRKLDRRMEDYQRANLYGFTTRELVELDAITSRNLKTPNISNNILPVMGKDRWEIQPDTQYGRTGSYPIGKGYSGDWNVRNPIVWAAIQPSLRLASRMLMNFHLLPWFDALLLGDTHPVDANRRPALLPNEKPLNLRTMHIRREKGSNVRSSFQTATERDDYFAQMCIAPTALELSFNKSSENALNGVPYSGSEPSSNAHAEAYFDPNLKPPIFRLYMNISNIEPLLNSNLTDAERLNGQWYVANTIVHEMMHLIKFVRKRYDSDENYRTMTGEPYFEDEIISELGFSMENAVFGGIPEIFGETSLRYGDNDSAPHLGHWLTLPYPSIAYALGGGSNTPILTDPPSINYQNFFPIKVTTIEDAHQEEFWDVAVRQFGFKALHTRSLKAGAIVHVKDQSNNSNPRRHTMSDNAASLIFPANAVTPIPTPEELLSMTPLERASSNYARRLVQSAKYEEDYIEDVTKVLSEAKKIVSAIASDTTGTVPYQTRQHLTTAIKYHLKARTSLILSEATDGIEYTDRRARLLRWNKNVRTFIRGLDPADSTGPQELYDLERARMSLSHPQNTATEAAELATLQHAISLLQTNQHFSCHEACTAIIEDKGRSNSIEAGARIARAALSQVRTLLARTEDLDTASKILVRTTRDPDLRDLKQIPEQWQATVGNWITAVRELSVNQQEERRANFNKAALAVTADVNMSGM